MQAEQALAPDQRSASSATSASSAGSSPARAVLPAAIFLLSAALLFLGMSDRPLAFDEGIALTDAMQVGAGLVPHRDFRAIYGPAHSYVLAGLFRLFGTSMIVGRAFGAVVAGLVIASMYLVALRVCRRSVALWVALTTALCLFELEALQGFPIFSVSLFSLWAAAALLPVFSRRISMGRSLAAGALAGVTCLYRYDVGVAVLGILLAAAACAVYLRLAWFNSKEYIATLWPLCAGFALVTVPPALYFLSVARFHDFYVDIIFYFSRYYVSHRGMPFPGFPDRRSLPTLAVYTPVAISLFALYVGVTGGLQIRGQQSFHSGTSLPERQRRGFLLLFGLLCLVMYLKGFVRPSVVQMYLSIVPSLLLIAVLFQYRQAFRRGWRAAIIALAVLSVLAPASGAAHLAWANYKGSLWMPQTMLAEARGTLPPEQQQWCRTPSPLTRGICFLPLDGRIRTIEFLRSHTSPQDKLFVANGRNDRVYVNDEILYFATQRLPATHWSQFDPPLQATLDIQRQIVSDLETNRPPYIVTDTEFDTACEPNESCKSTGVLLLDNYIHTQYRYVETDGVMTIWQRIQTP